MLANADVALVDPEVGAFVKVPPWPFSLATSPDSSAIPSLSQRWPQVIILSH